jgi:protein-S-isoprenylcysteine O-methyltransferase Ste14
MIALYRIACYAAFLATFAYGVAFVEDWRVVPITIDHGNPTANALWIDLALMLAFAVQHSGMARRRFKAFWTRTVVPPEVERSTYVLVASAMLVATFAWWRPMPGIVWHVPGLQIVSLAGWLIATLATFLLGHFELFGLRTPRDTAFRTPVLYRVVRHPIYLGFLIAFWATPTMTYGHLLFSTVMLVYVVLAIQLEERDLVAVLGDDYRRYRRRVRALVPLPKRR